LHIAVSIRDLRLCDRPALVEMIASIAKTLPAISAIFPAMAWCWPISTVARVLWPTRQIERRFTETDARCRNRQASCI
jgi:hypothetical protein